MSDYRSKGGLARALNQTPEERKSQASIASHERWNPTIPRATHPGVLKIGDHEIAVAVLSDGRRVISRSSIFKLMGRSRPGAKELKKAEREQIPVFLSASNLKSFIPSDLTSASAAIQYKIPSGKRVLGFECSILTITCEAYLRAREACILTKDQINLAQSCEILMRSLAKTGLVALIDECTGYDQVRDKFALQALLDKYLRKEFAEWAKRFPDSFYKEIFRLNNWKFEDIISKKPSIVGKYTNDIVYSRLLPELVDELEVRNPKNEAGYRDAKHHQWLNDVGHIDLNAHIRGVTAIMRASNNWKDFKELLDKIYPKKSSKDIFLIN